MSKRFSSLLLMVVVPLGCDQPVDDTTPQIDYLEESEYEELTVDAEDVTEEELGEQEPFGPSDLAAESDSEAGVYYGYYAIALPCGMSVYAPHYCRDRGWLGGWITGYSSCRDGWRWNYVQCYDKT